MSNDGVKVYKDILWYLFGTVVPIIITFIRTPIFTRYFTPEEYGNIGLISITFSYILIVIFAWVSSCLWRYYNKYKNNNMLNVLYSNVLFMFSVSGIVTTAICLIWISFSSAADKNLIILSFIQTIITQFIALYMIIVRLQGKAAIYNVSTVLLNAGNFIILLLLTFGMGQRIEATIESTIIVNIALLFYIFIKHKKIAGVSYKYIELGIMKGFLKYGLAISVGDLCFLLLTSSDRYIIKIFDSTGAVGIYNQVYNLGQMSVAALVSVFFNAANPVLFKELENNIDNCDKTMNNYIKLYTLLLLPITVYFSVFSKQIAIILLGEEFRVGYRMMPYIMFTSFIYGITQFTETKLNFSNKVAITVRGIIIASAINILLNFICIPLFNYQVAALTTLVSYIFLYFYYYFHDSGRYLKSMENIRPLSVPAAVLAIQVIADFIIRYICRVEIGVGITIVEGMIFLVIYLYSLKNQELNGHELNLKALLKLRNGVKEGDNDK